MSQKSRTIVLATANAGKIRELSAMLLQFQPDITVLGLKDFPQIGDIPETGNTFEANARLKAQAVARGTGLIAVADDSGLVVDALGGAPGVHSARYSGEQATDEKNMLKLLAALRNVPVDQRACHFACVMLATTPDGLEIIGHGVWPGRVAQAQRGTHGFGYDPIFFDPQLGLTAAEIDTDTKNKRSHRYWALHNLLSLWPKFWATAIQNEF